MVFSNSNIAHVFDDNVKIRTADEEGKRQFSETKCSVSKILVGFK